MEKDKLRLATLCTYFIVDTNHFASAAKSLEIEHISSILDEITENFDRLLSLMDEGSKTRIANSLLPKYECFLDDRCL